MQLVNLTPHALSILIDDDGAAVALLPSGNVARVEVSYTADEPIDADAVTIPTVRATYGAPVGLPSPVDGVGFVVSGMVLEALGGRRLDVFAPGELVRDAQGRPVGCRGLKRGG